MATRTPPILGPEFDHLPDDTEETLVGSSLHQGNIVALVTSLLLYARRHGLPWFVGNQPKMIVSRRGYKRTYQPSPDILVHPTLTSGTRTSLMVDLDGPPALIIEVASPSTVLEADLNLTAPNGKPRAYEEIGVAEYLVFDPSEEFITTQVWARRVGPHGYEPWEPDANGRWVSSALGGIAFAPVGLMLRVYDRDGQLLPLTEEYDDIVAERDRQVAARDRQLADYDQRLTERDRQVAERDRQVAERDREIAALQAELRRLRGEE